MTLTTQDVDTVMTKPRAWLCESADGAVRYVALTKSDDSTEWTQTPLFSRGEPLSVDQIYDYCKGGLTLLQVARIIEAAHGIR